FAQEAKDAFRATNLPLPRFVSVSAGEAYVRAGPGKKYPIKWVFKKKGLPVEIILEFDHWRKIRDHEGGEGWLHKSLLSGRRSAIVTGKENIPLTRKPQSDSKITAYLQPRVISRIKECTIDWCYVDASGYKGWTGKENLWGVYEKEIIEK
ncbi:MAG: SH3 domain-containing protein, partial [Alphaproteobacteria bacterium]